MTSTRVRLLPFCWWLLWFYAAWLTLVLAGGLWGRALAHWPIALVMVLGSYFAGSTPLGGGTVAFPVLVLFLAGPASLGRGFSFCIQATGMSSSALFLLMSGAPVAGRLLLWAMLGAAVTVPLSVAFLVPLVSDLAVKLAFSCLWAAFGLLTLLRLREIVQARSHPALPPRAEAVLGIAAGAVGGLVTGVIGVGADMVLYTALVLVCRCDLRVAIGTATIGMAFGSLAGTVTSAALGRLDAEVLYYWLAAAPIVVLGAPVGTFMMRVVPRDFTLVVVAILCVAQLVWTCVDQDLSVTGWVLALAVVLGANVLFEALRAAGRRLSPPD